MLDHLCEGGDTRGQRDAIRGEGYVLPRRVYPTVVMQVRKLQKRRLIDNEIVVNMIVGDLATGMTTEDLAEERTPRSCRG